MMMKTEAAMKFQCPLFAVKDITVCKEFYSGLLGQKLKYDFGKNIVFEGDFSFQQKEHFAQMISVELSSVLTQSHNAELYFEIDDFDDLMQKLADRDDLEFLHSIRLHDWGQRSIRFYDPDRHIIEVGENMDIVIARLLKEGNTPERVAQITQHPIQKVKSVFLEINNKRESI